MPATSTAFGNSNNLYIATCVTDPTTLGTTVTPSNVVVLPGNSVPLAAQAPATQQLQTPPRSNMFTMNQTVSPNFSQGNLVKAFIEYLPSAYFFICPCKCIKSKGVSKNQFIYHFKLTRHLNNL